MSRHRRDIDKALRWSEAEQHFMPVWWRRAISPCWLFPDERQFAAPLAVPAAGAGMLRVSFHQNYGSNQGFDDGLGTPLRINSLIFADSTDGTAAADFTVFMRDNGEQRLFMNQPVHVRTIAGTAQTPGKFREPYYMMSNNVVDAEFNKVAGGATTIRIYMAGAQYFPWDTGIAAFPEQRQRLKQIIRNRVQRKRFVWPFWLTTDPSPIVVAANATATVVVPIGADSHFEAMAWTRVSTGNFTVQVTETKTKQTLMNGPVDAFSAVGNANFPAIFPKPYLVPAGERLVFRFTDLSGAQNTIFFTIQGRRIYAPILNGRKVEFREADYEDISMAMPLPEGEEARS